MCFLISSVKYYLSAEIPDELIPFTEYPVIQPMRKLVVTAAPERPDDEDNGGEDEGRVLF